MCIRALARLTVRKWQKWQTEARDYGEDRLWSRAAHRQPDTAVIAKEACVLCRERPSKFLHILSNSRLFVVKFAQVLCHTCQRHGMAAARTLAQEYGKLVVDCDQMRRCQWYLHSPDSSITVTLSSFLYLRTLEFVEPSRCVVSRCVVVLRG